MAPRHVVSGGFSGFKRRSSSNREDVRVGQTDHSSTLCAVKGRVRARSIREDAPRPVLLRRNARSTAEEAAVAPPRPLLTTANKRRSTLRSPRTPPNPKSPGKGPLPAVGPAWLDPQSQSLSRSYGSNLPTSLTYIDLSTRGWTPWRPAAESGTDCPPTTRRVGSKTLKRGLPGCCRRRPLPLFDWDERRARRRRQRRPLPSLLLPFSQPQPASHGCLVRKSRTFFKQHGDPPKPRKKERKSQACGAVVTAAAASWAYPTAARTSRSPPRPPPTLLSTFALLFGYILGFGSGDTIHLFKDRRQRTGHQALICAVLYGEPVAFVTARVDEPLGL